MNGSTIITGWLGEEPSHQVSRFYAAHAQVGKGGTWDPDNQVYYYIDITMKMLHVLRVLDFHRDDYDIGTQVGAIALIAGGWGLVMAVEDGFGIFDFSKKKFELVASPYGVNSGWRMNDGGCDSKGRFWAGRLFKADQTQPGDVYRLETDGKSVTTVIHGIACTNGILWSPDNTLMYIGDSSFKKIFVWDYEEETGNVTNQRLFMDTSLVFEGVPDGANIDKDGFLWVCFYDGHKLVRISPNATIDRVYNLPVKRPTQPVWYGPKLNEFVITSASADVNLTDWPESGNILGLKVGVQGNLKARFNYSRS